MNIKPDYYHNIALLGFLGLFALLMLWNTVLASASTLPIALKLLLTVSPLLLPLRGFLSRTAKSCAWMAYISLAYFIHGAIETYVNAYGLLYPILEVSFSLMLFFGSTLYVHYTGKQE